MVVFLQHFAIYFVIWWITLFAVLPIGIRTQGEENEVVPGTVESAPAHFRGLRVVLITTLVAAVIHGGWHLVTGYFGVGLDDLPTLMPDFR